MIFLPVTGYEKTAGYFPLNHLVVLLAGIQ